MQITEAFLNLEWFIVEGEGLEPPVHLRRGFTVPAATNYRLSFQNILFNEKYETQINLSLFIERSSFFTK